MNKYIIYGFIFFNFFMLAFSGCKSKPKSATENVLPNKEILQQETVEVSQSNEALGTPTFIKSNVRGLSFEYGRYSLASCDLLKDDDLNYIPPRELRLIRNEIFARYGYRFKDTVLQAYFDKQDWYKPLRDDVEQYLTPLERANIKFILEKEKTNPDISDEEQFQIFLEKYIEYPFDGWQAPRMLLYKFLFVNNEIGKYVGQLPPANKYVYLINAYWTGCSTCPYSLSIYQFNKKGELLNKFSLGLSGGSPRIDKKSNNSYELWFTEYNGFYEEEEEYVYDDVLTDTIRIQFHYDVDGQIIITEKNN